MPIEMASEVLLSVHPLFMLVVECFEPRSSQMRTIYLVNLSERIIPTTNIS
jgi:hypothetical protein